MTAPNTPLTSANVAIGVPNGLVAAPTDYTIVSGDVSNGISIPASLFAGAISGLPFGQAGFMPEHLRIIAKTTAAGTNFKMIIKATQPRSDISNQLPFSPLANQGDLSFDLSTTGTRYIGEFTSGRVLQADGSLLINFSGTLGTTTIALLLDPYAPIGPRG
jgi:hypothetical protein